MQRMTQSLVLDDEPGWTIRLPKSCAVMAIFVPSHKQSGFKPSRWPDLERPFRGH
jgi:hypothetical protein